MKPVINRRQFLKSSAFAAAAIGFPAVIPVAAFGANDRIAIGCIGVGGMGTGNMNNFLAAPACRVVAVCDVRRDRREKAKARVDGQYGDAGCAAYNDFRELLACKDVDAVMIAVQDHWHALIATAAAAAGKDMYCEKPTGVCVNDGFAIRAAIRRNKRVFQSGLWQRSLGNFRQGCELALNGYLGTLTEVQVAVPISREVKPSYKGSLDPQPVPDGFDWAMWQGPARFSPFNPGRVTYPDWYLINDYCEGWTTNWGVHHLDIAHWGCPLLCKEPFEVKCDGTYYINQGFADNIVAWKAVFTYESGLRLVFTDGTRQQVGTKFIGDRGWVHVGRGDMITASSPDLLTIRPKKGDIRLLPAGCVIDDIATLKSRDGDRVAYRNLNHAEGLLDAMRNRRDPIADIDATHVASTLGMITGMAARLGTRLKWDWKRERFVDNDLANAMLIRPLHNGWKLEG